MSPGYDFVATLPYIPSDKLGVELRDSRSLSEITPDQCASSPTRQEFQPARSGRSPSRLHRRPWQGGNRSNKRASSPRTCVLPCKDRFFVSLPRLSEKIPRPHTWRTADFQAQEHHSVLDSSFRHGRGDEFERLNSLVKTKDTCALSGTSASVQKQGQWTYAARFDARRYSLCPATATRTRRNQRIALCYYAMRFWNAFMSQCLASVRTIAPATAYPMKSSAAIARALQSRLVEIVQSGKVKPQARKNRWLCDSLDFGRRSLRSQPETRSVSYHTDPIGHTNVNL